MEKMQVSKVFNHSLLPVYVFLETFRAVLTYAIIHSGERISPTFITLGAEICKLTFTTLFLCRYVWREHGAFKFKAIFAEISSIRQCMPNSAAWKAYVLYAVPAMLYLFNNLLYLFGLQITTPALLNMTMLMKFPITAVFHHFLVTPQRNLYAWLSLSAICIGLGITNIAKRSNSEANIVKVVTHTAYGDFLGPIVGLTIATISGLTSTYTEILMKHDVSFWTAQFWLYLYGTTFAGIIAAVGGRHLGSVTHSDHSHHPWFGAIAHATVIIVTAATGLAVANILRKKNNLVKLVGTSMSIVTIIIAQFFFFPVLRKTTFNFQTIAGGGIICIATWTYNYYRKVPWNSQAFKNEVEYSELEDNSQVEEETDGESAKTEQSSTQSMTTPTPLRIGVAAVFVALLSLSTFVYNHATEPAVSDLKIFFKSYAGSPAIWGHDEGDSRCVERWIKSASVKPESTEFKNWEVTFMNSSCPIYPIPDGGMIFHQYWNGPWRSFIDLSIKAFLATQRLEYGHKLMFWYENGGPPADVRASFTNSTSRWRHHVEFRKFDRAKEALGTCMEQKVEWLQLGAALPEQVNSDLVRNLLLAKYGGIWLNPDMVLLRDLTPLIRVGPSAPSLYDEDWTNHVVVAGPKISGTGKRMLETSCALSYDRATFEQQNGKDALQPLQWDWLYTDGLLKNCADRSSCGVSRLSAVFTDGFQWIGTGQKSISPCEVQDLSDPADGTEADIPSTLHTLWTWNTRLREYPDACLDTNANSVAARVNRLVNQILKTNTSEDGRDLFP